MTTTPPLISGRETKDRGYTLSAHADTLSDENYFRIIEDSTGEEVTIPSRFIKFLNNASYSFNDVVSKKSIMQQKTNLPTELSSNLVFASPNDESRIILTGSDASTIGTPMLVWVRETSRNIQEKNGYGSETPLQAAGWRLELSGISEAPLGFAKWDDIDGIRNLISHMGDGNALSVQLVLTAPERAKILRASDTLIQLVRGNNLPVMLPIEVKKTFKQIGLSQNGKGQIVQLQVPVDGVYSVVAIGIVKKNVWGQDFWMPEHQTRLGRLSGWIQVDPTNPSMMASGKNKTRPIWITRLTREQWNTIEPALGINCSVGNKSSWF